MLLFMGRDNLARVITGAVVQYVQNLHFFDSLLANRFTVFVYRVPPRLKHDYAISLVVHNRVIELASTSNAIRQILEFDLVFFGAMTA